MEVPVARNLDTALLRAFVAVAGNYQEFCVWPVRCR